MISAGLIVIGTLVVAINLIVFDIPPELQELLAIPAVWLQMGRWFGVVASLAGGGVLLWYVLRQ
jgi:hypothetical protein